MKVLMISGDRNVLVEGNPAHERISLMRTQVERLDVFVWPQVHRLRDIAKAVRETKYDVVTSQDPFWRGFVAYHAARRCGAKLNIQMHTEFDAQSVWRRLIGSVNLRRADSVRVVSQKIKDSLEKLALRAPITVLPVFVDLTPFSHIERTKHPHFKKTILWIGRFESEKDPIRAVEVLREVRRELSDTGLIMLGAGSLEKALHARAKARGLERWVEFPGWQHIATYLSQADVVLSTSKFEGYGVSIVEALAAGVPVVAPDVGIAKEAGAIIAPRPGLPGAVLGALRLPQSGILKLTILSEAQWVQAWGQSL